MYHKFECIDNMKCASEFEKRKKKTSRNPCIIKVHENGMGTAEPEYCPYSGIKVLFVEVGER